ncbi:elongation factor P maturation arginine rhamnosyltransferase EarP [Pollutimonas bauzanensis]|uniref:elongation factor P maturation arginine rhamnosyltransferase EarP n=1 Tax=Pollutimonas bauzanensis TaxID=658167 RepID=UPI001160D5F0|nr:elongation factor P maturation arginine rhamnosyltransferase EarP [Pollutimonas bauzanensis]
MSFDIFCRVVDNFGDIGVCWRLARQLARLPPGREVRLWVDDLHSFGRIEPGVDPQAAQQSARGVDIVHWTQPAPVLRPHAVVIEAFACDPPAAFIEAMVRQDSLWINLEYLSAEGWVESCHTLPSAQHHGLRKHFFFPGFTPATGGLLREPGLLSERDEWLAQPGQRDALLGAIGVPGRQIERLRQGARQVFLFCYPDAPAQGLLDSLERQACPTLLIVPRGVYPGLQDRPGGRVHVHEMPFVDQAAFDRLLWSSDLNFVRGEDSLVRALWAGKPLVWQIYAQDANTHMIKLQAWLDRSPCRQTVHALMRDWNLGDPEAFALRMNEALEPGNWAQWQSDSAQWSDELAGYPDLAYSLVGFCTQRRRSG